jgi:hypothetical protein
MQPDQPLLGILVNPALRIAFCAEAGHNLSSTVWPLRNYTFTEADLVFFDRK